MIIVVEVYQECVLMSRCDGGACAACRTLSAGADMSGVDSDIRIAISELAEGGTVEAMVLYSPWGSCGARRFLSADRNAWVKLRGLTELFPFYMPFFMAVLRSCTDALPGIAPYILLGNSFFSALYRHSVRYAVAEPFATGIRARCQGRHGLFHEYHAQRMNGSGKLVSVVFDNQPTVCGMHKGIPRTISTGGTSLEGIMGRSSCGDVDPGIPFYLMQEGYSLYAVDDMLKKQSGFRGLCGFDGSMDELFRLYGTDKDVTLAVDVFLTHLLKYLGEAMAIIGGIDELVFGGPRFREFAPLVHMMTARLSFLGLRLDPQCCAFGQEGRYRISTPDSEIPVGVVNDSVAAMVSYFYAVEAAASGNIAPGDHATVV